jgi:hypothetical protein
MDEVKLPPDLELRMMIEHQRYLSEQHERILSLLVSHEIELACLWLSVVGLAIAVVVQHSKLKEGRSE